MSQVEGVKVHTCHNVNTQFRALLYLNPDRLYYTTDPKFKVFKALPDRCNCKKRVTDLAADTMLEKGAALPVYKPSKSEVMTKTNGLDRTQIITVVNRVQTPRVDLITRADVERAYNDLSHPFYDPSNPKCYLHRNPRDAEYMQHIEDVHHMLVQGLLNLMVPFRPDPDEMRDAQGRLFAGRLLFPFGADQRTAGGH